LNYLNHPSELQQKMVAASQQHQCANIGLGVAIQRPETEIESVIKRTDNAVSRLHSRIDALCDRLSRVRTPVGVAASGAVGGAPKSVMSPLGEDIRGIKQQIDGAVDRLEALLRDLAL
jgi:hypothetical protein